MKNKVFISQLILFLFLQACGKKTEETQPTVKNIQETVFASGVLQADGLYKLTAQTTGYITKLNFKEGDIVTKNSVLAAVENQNNDVNLEGATQLLNIAKSNASDNAPLLIQAEENINISKEKMNFDKNLVERYKKLWKANSIAKIDYENAVLNYKTSKGNYENALENYKKLKEDAYQQVISNQTTTSIYKDAKNKMEISAVKMGKVYKKYKELGDYVKQGEVIAEIGDPNTIYALVNIDESTISKIKVGQKATIQLNTDKTTNYSGIVKEILPSFDATSQSFLCKIYFEDQLDFKIINTQLQTNILIGRQENALLIPRNYIDFGGYVQEKGKEEKTKVATKFVSSDWVQVTSGIDKNAVLITDNIKGN